MKSYEESPNIIHYGGGFYVLSCLSLDTSLFEYVPSHSISLGVVLELFKGQEKLRKKPK
ncbi:hypothetical protein KI387_038853, partial [Taxus chinensis]